jgi:ABC-type phosphate/phosphonate transport system substrate-binding protein
VVRVCYFLPAVLAVVVSALPRVDAQPPAASPLPEVKIGLPTVLFRDIHPGLIDIAAKPFKEMIQKTAGMNGSLVIGKDYNELTTQIQQNQVDIVLFHGFEYAWAKTKTDKLVPLVITLPNCGKVQACLVVNVASKATELKDIKTVAIPKGSKAHCQMFLEKLREELPDGFKDRCQPVEIKNSPPTSEDILDDLVSETGKCDAALVDISQLQAYQGGKPGAAACLKIFKESQLLPAAVVCCRKGSLTPDQMEKVKNGLLGCHKTAIGKTFIMFWNLKGFGEVTKEYLDLVAKARETYPEAAAPKK